jgi:hypothetical protein
LLLVSAPCFSQPGELRGMVRNAETGEGLPFANVAILAGAAVYTGTSADSAGNYRIKPLDPGFYTVKVSYVGLSSAEVQRVGIRPGAITFLDFALGANPELPPVVISDYRDPLVDKDRVSTMHTIDAERIDHSPAITLAELVEQSPGVVRDEATGNIHIRGSRDNATRYYVDGMKVLGSYLVPRRSIARIEVITGGIPAQYGDVTGGIVVITTKSYLGR